MSRLTELADALDWIANEDCIPSPNDKHAMQDAADILRAADGDVAGLMAMIDEPLGAYWDAAYAEGRTFAAVDEDGRAQKALNDLRDTIRAALKLAMAGRAAAAIGEAMP